MTLHLPIRITFERVVKAPVEPTVDPSQSLDQLEQSFRLKALRTSHALKPDLVLNYDAVQEDTSPLEIDEPPIIELLAKEANTAATVETTVTAHTPEELNAYFKKFDWDDSGDLDTFELASAVAEVWGKPPSTAQVAAMVHVLGAHDVDDRISLENFAHVLGTNWAFVQHGDPIGGIQTGLSETLFELEFREKSLGFSLVHDQVHGRMAVSGVKNAALEGRLLPGDAIMFVNGVPLGFVSHTKILQERIGSLKRPLTITFERHSSTPHFDEPSDPTTGLKLLRAMSSDRLVTPDGAETAGDLEGGKADFSLSKQTVEEANALLLSMPNVLVAVESQSETRDEPRQRDELGAAEAANGALETIGRRWRPEDSAPVLRGSSALPSMKSSETGEGSVPATPVQLPPLVSAVSAAEAAEVLRLKSSMRASAREWLQAPSPAGAVGRSAGAPKGTPAVPFSPLLR